MFRRTKVDLSEFVAYLKVSRGLSNGTINIYVRWVGRYLTDAPKDLRAWVVDVAVSPATFTQACSGVKAWAKYRRDKALLGELEDIDRPRQAKGLPKPIEGLEDKLARMPLQARLVATVFHETGMRLSEGYSVHLGDIIPAQIVIRGKGSKDRIVLLNDTAREALRALGGSFPNSKRWFQRECEKVGTHAHALRHSFACELAASGADLGEIQDSLGHASPATSRVYAAYSVERLRAAQERRAAFVAAQG